MFSRNSVQSPVWLRRLLSANGSGRGAEMIGFDSGQNLKQKIDQIEVDLFIVAGQSNAVGQGEQAMSEDAPHGLYISGSTINSTLADPVGNAESGSMWPSFSNEWFNQTGRKSAFVTTAVGGSALLSGSDSGNGNWSSSGSLRASAVSAANDAVSAINSDDAYILKNVYVLWCQGERDAQSINGTTVTGATYKAELEALAAYFAANITGFSLMGVIQSSTLGAAGALVKDYDEDIKGFQDIRAAQMKACNASANLKMLYTGASSFVMLHKTYDGIHWRQVALNRAGKCAAKGLNSNFAMTNVNPFVSSASYPDDGLGSKTSVTHSHTLAAFSETLVVCVSACRASTTNDFDLSIKFAGVEMRKATIVSSSNSIGRVKAGIYVLTGADFGRSLDRVSGDIVVESTALVNQISVAAINLKEVHLMDSDGGVELAFGSPATTSESAVISTYRPAIVINACGSLSNATSVGAVSATNLTELVDGGWSDGATRSAQFHVGYQVENTPVLDRNQSYTFPAAQTEIAIASISLRGLVAGEKMTFLDS